MKKMFGTYRAPRKVLRFTISGYARTDGCLEVLTDNTLYKSKKSAAKAIAQAINQVIEEHNATCDKDCGLPYVNTEDCLNGYIISAYNDSDDRTEWRITQHVIDPINI